MIDIRWERRLHQAGSVLALAPGHLVVHERNTRLVSLDPVDGSVRWDVPVGTWPRAVAIAGSRCLVIPQNTDQLLCLDLDSGERVWAAGPYGFVGHLVVAGDVVFAGGWRGYTPLRALDLETGRLRWKTDHREHTVLPLPVGEGLLVGRPGDNIVRLIDQRDARPLTTWTLPQPLVDHRPAFVADGSGGLLVRCGSRAIARLVPSTGTTDLLVEAEHDLAPVAVNWLDGRLWLWERRGGYTLANAADGRLLGRVGPGQQLVRSVVPTRGGFVVADTSGALLRVSPQGQIDDRVVVGRRIRALRSSAPSGLLVLTKGSLLVVGLGNSARPQ
ncbi:outer membrane protein assembly factor BamB family protein [Saccharopolyspora sp. NPDC003752]